MSLIIRVIHAEIIKSKGTKGMLLSILFPLLISIILFFVLYVKYDYFAETGINPWELLGTNYFRISGIIIMPMYILMIAYLINYTEHKSNSWKYLFTLPIPKLYIYGSKFLLITTWMLFFVIFSCILFFLSGYLLSILRPQLLFSDYDSRVLVLKTFSQMFISGFGILSIQFFLSIYWDDFIRPVSVGVGLIVVTMLLNSWEYIYLLPYSHPYSVSKEFTGNNDANFTYYILYGLAISVVFLAGGYFIISKKEQK